MCLPHPNSYRPRWGATALCEVNGRLAVAGEVVFIWVGCGCSATLSRSRPCFLKSCRAHVAGGADADASTVAALGTNFGHWEWEKVCKVCVAVCRACRQPGSCNFVEDSTACQHGRRPNELGSPILPGWPGTLKLAVEASSCSATFLDTAWQN